jgi:heme exporter protein CcmD
VTDAPHWGFVAAAYAVAALAVLAMVVTILADYRVQSAALRRLEQRANGGEPCATPSRGGRRAAFWLSRRC